MTAVQKRSSSFVTAEKETETEMETEVEMETKVETETQEETDVETETGRKRKRNSARDGTIAVMVLSLEGGWVHDRGVKAVQQRAMRKQNGSRSENYSTAETETVSPPKRFSLYGESGMVIIHTRY